MPAGLRDKQLRPDFPRPAPARATVLALQDAVVVHYMVVTARCGSEESA
jgi:hypothetical protein